MKRLNTTDPGFEADFTALLNQARETTSNVGDTVAAIISDIRARGDEALCDYTTRWDRMPIAPDRLRITEAEIEQATASVPAELLEALESPAARQPIHPPS
jgi:histidinol dehydrogenase